MKTAHQIQSDFYFLLKLSRLSKNITGSVYREGYRPKDSKKEDAIVIFTTGTPTQIQQGRITINIYVPFINKGGILIEDGKRCEQVEAFAQQWVDSIKGQTAYQIDLSEIIHTNQDEEIQQSFIVVKLNYQIIQ